MISLNTPVCELPGVGPARAKGLARLGLFTAEDLLHHFPRDYEDRRQMCTIASAPADRPVCLTALVAQPPVLSHIRRGLDLVKLRVVDGSAAMLVTFFNQAYVKNALHTGGEYVFYGQVEASGRMRRMTNPVFEPVGRQRYTGRIMPVYPLTAGVSNHLIAGLVQQVLADALDQVPDALPAHIRQAHGLPPVREALVQIHFPDDPDRLSRARRRMIFEELFTLCVGLSLLKHRRDQSEGPVFPPADTARFLALLPFAPTAAQRRVMDDIAADVRAGAPMNRLVQGDVGSGKTAVAAYGAWLAWKSGFQSALMAPTEILAEQHWRTLSALLEPAGMKVGLLTGGLKPAEKKAVCAAAQDGSLDLLVGTHALITPQVHFRRLGLVAADEQHRFGVGQRSALAAKGSLTPHTLFLSATPIPRTLALIIYGDLDVSVLDELPPGRAPVATYLIGEDKRQRMYGFVRKLVAQGRQVYLVCPAVEENPELARGGGAPPDLKAVTAYAQELRQRVFPDLRVGFVHGRLKGKDKEAVMAAFAAGELDVLVSTTVIEVGVDVPNAALMVVENAERFGLSQLHQLRGRVGRGGWQSYCVLVSSSRSPDSLARLRVLAATNDGFQIAEEDLKLRGPGDFFGQRQHGLPQLKVADFASDLDLLRQAQDAARTLAAADPRLAAPEHRLLLEQVRQMFSRNPNIFN